MRYPFRNSPVVWNEPAEAWIDAFGGMYLYDRGAS
jgi:hypothetical protein